MKQKKALKRLAKSESLISDVTKRYSASAPDTREVLQDAKAGVARAKEAVSLHVSSKVEKRRPVKKWKKTAVRNAAVEAPTRKTAKKRKSMKKAEEKAAAKKPSAAVQTATEG
jgi:hypothetical protein